MEITTTIIYILEKGSYKDKTKIKSHGYEVTDSYNKNIPKVDSSYTYLAVISLDSAFKKDDNYYPQVYLKASAKLRALRALVHHVPRALRVLVPHVPRALCAKSSIIDVAS